MTEKKVPCLCAFGPVGENKRVLTDSYNSDFIHLDSFGEHLCPSRLVLRSRGNPGCVVPDSSLQRWSLEREADQLVGSSTSL